MERNFRGKLAIGGNAKIGQALDGGPTGEDLTCFLPFLNTQWSTGVRTITQPLNGLRDQLY